MVRNFFFGNPNVEVISVIKMWDTKHKPLWKSYLDDAPNHVIEETGLTKEQVENVLQVLYDHRIIN
jgi:hypothetical protein